MIPPDPSLRPQLGPTPPAKTEAVPATRSGPPSQAAGPPAPSATPAIAEALPERALNVETLKNGVRIIVNPRPESGVVSYQIGVGSGSLQDPHGKEGAAHLIEHMFFQGGGGRSAEQIRSEIDALGGQSNAYTGRKQIVFQNSVPKHEALRGVELLTDIFANPNIDPKVLEKEKGVVTNELWQRMGIRQAQAQVDAGRLVLGDQPLSSLPIGTAGSVARVQAADVEGYIKEHFTGRNTVVLVEGDPAAMQLDVLRERLAKLPAGKATTNGKVFTGFRDGALVQTVQDATRRQTALDVTFPGLPESDKLAPAASILGTILGGGFSSKLNASLREKHQLTYGVNAVHDADHEVGTFTVTTDVDTERARQAVGEMAKILHAAPEQITDQDVEAAKRQVANNLVMATDDPSAEAEQLFQTMLTGAPEARSIKERVQEVMSVTADDVRQAARRVMDFRNVKIATFGGLGDSGPVQAGLADAGVDVQLKNVPFDEARYAEVLGVNPNGGEVQSASDGPQAEPQAQPQAHAEAREHSHDHSAGGDHG